MRLSWCPFGGVIALCAGNRHLRGSLSFGYFSRRGPIHSGARPWYSAIAGSGRRSRRAGSSSTPSTTGLVQPSSVDVRVDRRFRVFHNSRYPYIDVRQPMDELTELVEIEGDEPFILHPGEFVLGQTLERVDAAERPGGPARGQELARPARPADPFDRRLRRHGLLRQPDARAVERREPPDHDLPRDADRADLVHADGRAGGAPVRLAARPAASTRARPSPRRSRFYLNFERKKPDRTPVAGRVPWADPLRGGTLSRCRTSGHSR